MIELKDICQQLFRDSFALDFYCSQASSNRFGSSRTFVSYHDFAEHFAKSYGLNVACLVDVPEKSATCRYAASDWSGEGSDLKTLLREPAQPGDSLSSLAKETNAQISEFNPMESSGLEGLSPNYYITTMEQNSENLETAFAQSAR